MTEIPPKYPRTPHLPWSNTTNDERILSTTEFLVGNAAITVSEKLDGCLSSQSKVSMADGTRKQITTVAPGDVVLGMTEDGVVVPSRVMQTWNNGKADRWLMVRWDRRSAGRGSSFGAIQCTPNHLFWLPDIGKYVPAERLRSGDRVLSVRSELNLTPIQRSVLLGKILGDGSLYISEYGSGSVSWGHRVQDIDYVEWTARGCGNLARHNSRELMSGYGSKIIHQTTAYHPCIAREFRDFKHPVTKRKVLPDRVGKMLDPIVLAFWYMDDGSISEISSDVYQVYFSVCSFTSEECSFLQQGLQRVGVDSIYYEHRGHPYLRLNTDNAERFFLLVAPYIPPSMQRKLPPRYRGHDGWLPDLGKGEYKPILVAHEVTSVSDEAQYKSCRYDITTETGNFFANGVLVHNSGVCLTKEGVWARSRNGTPQHPSFDRLKALHAGELKARWPNEYQDLVLYGEWLAARHSIAYYDLPSYLFLYAAYQSGVWLSWTDLLALASLLKIPTVPVLWRGSVRTEALLKELTLEFAKQPSVFGPEREGLVVRYSGTFAEAGFEACVAKWVRANHVQTDDHWSHEPVVWNELRKTS